MGLSSAAILRISLLLVLAIVSHPFAGFAAQKKATKTDTGTTFSAPVRFQMDEELGENSPNKDGLSSAAQPSPTGAGTRVALVIGNSIYENVPRLSNPVNDATDLSASLKRLGFEVKTLTNVRYDEMRRALIDFGQQARGVELALIFFAGHGIQIGGENWLIPVDAQLATDLNVANETIGLQSLTRAVSNASKLGLVILDACRSNPFLPKMQSTNLSRAVERGFSRVEPSDNVLVAYAARDGTTASDGSGRNSPFTSSLLRNIETPNLEITFLFRNVRDDVMAATNKQQQPFIYGSLSKEMIYLKYSTGAAAINTPSENAHSPMRPLKPLSESNASDPKKAGNETPRTLSSDFGLTLTPAAVSETEGVGVAGLTNDSLWADRGLKAGDIILEVAGRKVANPEEVVEAIKAARAGGHRSVLIRVRAGNSSRFIAMPLA